MAPCVLTSVLRGLYIYMDSIDYSLSIFCFCTTVSRLFFRGLCTNMCFSFCFLCLGVSMMVSSPQSQSSFQFARLCLQHVKHNKNKDMLSSILHILAHNPKLCKKLPKFIDDRQYTGHLVKGTLSSS